MKQPNFCFRVEKASESGPCLFLLCSPLRGSNGHAAATSFRVHSNRSQNSQNVTFTNVCNPVFLIFWSLKWCSSTLRSVSVNVARMLWCVNGHSRRCFRCVFWLSPPPVHLLKHKPVYQSCFPFTHLLLRPSVNLYLQREIHTKACPHFGWRRSGLKYQVWVNVLTRLVKKKKHTWA